MLTKEDLLKGTRKTKKVMIEELGGEIEIRPLNEEQWAEIEAKRVEMFQVDVVPVMKKDKSGKEVYDPEKTRENIKFKSTLGKGKKTEFEMDILTCKYGMTIDITEDELKQISPPGIVKKIAQEIMNISKVTKEELKELESFRTK
jgi:hypothetical protein